MSSLTVHFRGMSGSVDIEVPEGASVADAREAAGIASNLGVAANGVRLGSDDEVSTPVYGDQTLTTLPPEVKAGARSR